MVPPLYLYLVGFVVLQVCKKLIGYLQNLLPRAYATDHLKVYHCDGVKVSHPRNRDLCTEQSRPASLTL